MEASGKSENSALHTRCQEAENQTSRSELGRKNPEAEVPMSAVNRRERIEAMLADDPNDPELRYLLAMEYVGTGDDAGAVRCFDELMQRSPEYPPAYHQAARALQRLDRIAEAKDVLRRGIPVALGRGDTHAAGEMQQLLEFLETL
jgi:predicted Zn-dependent protease